MVVDAGEIDPAKRVLKTKPRIRTIDAIRN